MGFIVQRFLWTIAECSAAYGASRSDAAPREDLIFTAVADMRILDENGSMTPPIDGAVLSGNCVGAATADYDPYLVLPRTKRRTMAGFGSAIKYASIGLASTGARASSASSP